MSLDRTGLLIIRAWLEDGSSKPLRARVRLTTDVTNGFDSEVMLADVHTVTGVVEAWLEDILRNEPPAERAAYDPVTLS